MNEMPEQKPEQKWSREKYGRMYGESTESKVTAAVAKEENKRITGGEQAAFNEGDPAAEALERADASGIEIEAVGNALLLADHERFGTKARALMDDLTRMAHVKGRNATSLVKKIRAAVDRANGIIATAQRDKQNLIEKHPGMADKFRKIWAQHGQ